MGNLLTPGRRWIAGGVVGCLALFGAGLALAPGDEAGASPAAPAVVRSVDAPEPMAITPLRALAETPALPRERRRPARRAPRRPRAPSRPDPAPRRESPAPDPDPAPTPAPRPAPRPAPPGGSDFGGEFAP